MKVYGFLTLNLLLFMLCALVLGTIQSSLWYLVLGSIPPPMFWIAPIVYVALYRPAFLSVISIYMIGFSLVALSSIPIGQFLLSLLLLFAVLSLAKQRFFWPGLTYFVLNCLAASFLYPLIYWIVSLATETNSLPYPHPWSWVMGVLLTPAFVSVLYPLFMYFDKITGINSHQEITTNII